MYAEVCAVVNQCEFNSKGNLYTADAKAIKAGIEVGLGTIKGAKAKAKRLYENSVGVVRTLRRDKEPLNRIPTQATPTEVRDHLEGQNITTEAQMVSFWNKETPREDWEKMVIKIAGELITCKMYKVMTSHLIPQCGRVVLMLTSFSNSKTSWLNN